VSGIGRSIKKVFGSRSRGKKSKDGPSVRALTGEEVAGVQGMMGESAPATPAEELRKRRRSYPRTVLGGDEEAL
jgi:hypothetical protein